ncbi:DUF1572 domain-containing protein [Chitinophaga pendula]|uniref:DUF1572 family protein n=1 Tax=Chitinophaga TaxID=79328 RepID=UPI000BAFB1D1|nr:MULTISPECIES: DUF1572 family protein [Chitinophaga]ASZ12036.1 hypothetical protein CK934_14230 [Chitinophaga sp. MD30]UCJ04931.1 DUF1572 domain-containing protein [Chitinophaga pendula]
MSVATIYLDSVLKRLQYYKSLGDKTLFLLSAEQLHWSPDSNSNSIYLIVKHVSGNMLSRWTDFLYSDGEKPNRQRDLEFEEEEATKEEVIAIWEKGWKCMLDAIGALSPGDLERIVLIRNEEHSALDAINRQLAHIPYHVGQIIYAGKMLAGDRWESLSIPKGKSEDFNKTKFGK